MPKALRERLLNYVKEQNVDAGCVFCTKNGAPLDRSNI